MDDPQRQPRDRDRSQVGDRIRRAAEQGRISAADRDIRLRNVASAQSMTELDMIARDLDVLESTLTAGSPSARPVPAAPLPPTVSAPGSAPEPVTPVDVLVDRSRGSFRPGLIVGIALTVFAIIAAGAIGLFVSAGQDSAGDRQLFDPVQSMEASPEPGDEPGDEPGAGASYALDRDGLSGFRRLYRERFGTTRVTGATFYPDYAIVEVPVPGKSRHQGWIYRNDSGFTDFGGTRADFPGTGEVDLARLDLEALLRNLARAKRTLKVEDVSQTYVVVRYLPGSDEAPMANIYVSNEFSESGYLSTTVSGRVIRAHPYGG